MTRRWLALLVLCLGLVAGTLGYIWHLGYFGGSLYTLVPADAPAPPDRQGLVAVLLSGDMGFNTGMGPRIADHLAAEGMPVLGVNSLTYFARRRTPAEAAAYVEQAVARAEALPGARRVVLIGQSFGANVALVGVPGLPAALRAKLAAVELVVPADTMTFRATPGGVIDLGHDGPALPYARAVTGVPVLCIHGAEEADSLCPIWRAPNVRSVALPGGHFLENDAAAVAHALVAGPIITESSGTGQRPATSRRP
ncbi:AcvB/VirJ family lysyl-phosphatidylglycerol hydrolase [uncultured Sphingomonas sp.]|uniref:AcvB/VirJ family lysyl-phosphatidylglycerol hydrolase n=1 Tax=uncultured Sphingomonas sp. TaxID=158754 RepID=UPI0025F882A1|nr:AcvB/VirJ family lysyl-phosphatidylglycerol hydrolase [uncultured Sphingomonas sp.]